MSGRGILDADMATLGRMIADGWRWWIDELRGMVPQRWLHASDRLRRLAVVDGALIAEDGQRTGREGQRVIVVVPAALCLFRRIERPMVSDRDRQRMLALESDTLLPFPAGTMLIAGRTAGPAEPAGRAIVDIAGLPVEQARRIAAAIEAGKVVAARVIAEEADAGLPPLDFLPAMRDAALLARPRSAAPLVWALVGFLVLLNLALLVWRDQARVERLEALVAEQRPAVSASQRIARRIERDRMLVTRSLALRRGHDALGGLALVSEAVPAGAWLQRYAWDGATVRLTGYRSESLDLAGALRKSGRLSEVRSTSDETQAQVISGQPFDLTARIGAP